MTGLKIENIVCDTVTINELYIYYTLERVLNLFLQEYSDFT